MNQAAGTQICFVTQDELEACLIGMGDIQCEMEGLSELDHGLQCAEVLNAMAPLDLELQVAGLVHDVGAAHSLDRDHGRVGGQAVRSLLGERIAELVRLHVDAKRYLVASDPAYRARLSPVSLQTLERQGGGMSAMECAAFEASPHHLDAIRLREADDLAKTPGKTVPGLGAWRPALHRVIHSAR